MRQPKPKLSSTLVHPRTGEWLPATFEAFLVELDGLSTQATVENSLLLYRGHRDHLWRLDSTFVREVKRRLFEMDPTEGFAPRLHNSLDLNATLTGLLLLKFGSLVGPSPELVQRAAEHGVDPLFELMKRYQQYPAEDMLQLPGTNLLDWSSSQDIALYFANEQRSGEGAIFVCDATATGNTLQVIPVDEILSKLRDRMLAGMAHGAPLLFSPKRQIGYLRAKNQQAVYFAQMDLRIDLLEQWRRQEQAQPDSTILVKIVLPEGSVSDCQAYLADKGINAQYVCPDMKEVPQRIENIAFELPGVEAGSDLDNLFKAVGFVVIQWGNAEQTLDLLVVAVFSRFSDHELLKRRPTQLERKIEFLRKCFATFPELSPFKNECDDLLNRFEGLRQSRHDIVHGAIDSMSADNGIFTFTKIDVKPKDHHEARTVVLDNAEWAEYRRALIILGKDGISLARQVWDALKA